nr:hypothetical protein [Tanacetum cinerariifolium]
FGPQPRPDNYVEPKEPDVIISMEDDTIHGRFHVESPIRSNDAPKPTANAASRAEDPSMLTILSDKLDRRKLVIADSDEEAEVAAAKEDDIDLDEITSLATAALGSEQPAVSTENVEPMEEQEEMEFHTPTFARFRSTISTGVPSLTVVPEPAASYVTPDTAGPSVPADKGKAPMPDLDIPGEFLAEDAQARKRLEEEQASECLVQQLLTEDLAQEHVPNISKQRQKELDALMMRMTEADWMNALKERKKRALADLRYRSLQNKPMKKSKVTEFMRAFVKGQWCAAHNGTITMQKVRAMHKQQLIEEYEYICKRFENDRLLSAQHSLFRPKHAITEPSAKRQRVEEPSSQPATVSATSVSATVVSAAPDTSSLGASTFSVESQAKPVSAAPRFTDSTVITTAAMDSAVTRRKVGVSLFADSAADASPFLSSIAGGPTPSNVFDVSAAPTVSAPRFFVADQIPVATVSATSVSATVVSAAPDTSSLGASNFSVESQAKPVSVAPRFTDSTVITTAAMDSAVTRRKVGVSPFADSAADASPFLSSIAGGPSPFNEFFLDSDEEISHVVSRVAAEPDSDDEVVTEILCRGQSICGNRVVFVETLPDDEIADPREAEVAAEVAAAKEDDIDLDKITALAIAALGPEQPAVPTENFHTLAFTRFRSTISTGVPSPTFVPEPAASYVAPNTAGPSVPADKGKALMPDLDIPAEFLAEDAQARKRLEENQASE